MAYRTEDGAGNLVRKVRHYGHGVYYFCLSRTRRHRSIRQRERGNEGKAEDGRDGSKPQCVPAIYFFVPFSLILLLLPRDDLALFIFFIFFVILITFKQAPSVNFVMPLLTFTFILTLIIFLIIFQVIVAIKVILLFTIVVDWRVGNLPPSTLESVSKGRGKKRKERGDWIGISTRDIP